MTIETVAFFIPLFALFLYVIFFAIESAAALILFAPGLLGRRNHTLPEEALADYISPRWEATNVFLVFALVAFVAFFPGAVPIWGPALITPAFLFLVVMGLRTIGMLAAFYAPSTRIARRPTFFFLTLTHFLASAILFGGTVPFFLFGVEGDLPRSLWFGAIAALASFVIGTAFFNHRAKRATGTLLWLLASIASAAIVFFGTAVAALPYAVYPYITLHASFTDPVSARYMLIGLGIGIILVLPAFYLLYRLFSGKEQ